MYMKGGAARLAGCPDLWLVDEISAQHRGGGSGESRARMVLHGQVVSRSVASMKMTRTSVVFEYRLISTFENLRRRLLSEKLADRLDKPLAYWVLPNDRRLPLAFMGRSLRELLETP